MSEDRLVKAIDRLAAAVERLTRTMAAGQQTEGGEPCVRCGGRGAWAPGVPCETCDGSGHQ